MSLIMLLLVLTLIVCCYVILFRLKKTVNTAKNTKITNNYTGRGEKLNKRVFIAVGLFHLVWYIRSFQGPVSLMGIPFFIIFWLYVYAIVLLLEWLVLHIKKLGVPRLPWVPEKYNGKKSILWALITFVVIFTAVREGAFAPFVYYNISWYSSRTTKNSNNSFRNSSSKIGDAPDFLLSQNRYITCSMIQCSPQSSVVCEEFSRHFTCDNHHPERKMAEPVLYVTVTVTSSGDSACYTPLIKKGHLRFDAQVTITGNRQSGNGRSYVNHTLTLHTTFEQTISGIASCYQFNKDLGKKMAAEIAGEINAYIKNH